MRKKILLIGYNYSPELTGIGKYSGEMINWLAEKGYDCTVITAYPYYPSWKIQYPYSTRKYWFSHEIKQFETGGTINIYRCPLYVPSYPTGVRRILLDFTFLLSATLKLLQLVFVKKFDFIIAISPSFLLGILGVIYKKIFGAKFMYHIHDLQIEAARNLRMIKSEYVINLLFKVEQYIFNECDVISSISEGMVQKIQEKFKCNVYLLPNWANTKLFYPIENRNDLKRQFGFNVEDKIILYSGAIGEKQGLESILHLAVTFREDANLKFIICGAGPYKEVLQTMVEDMNICNVKFFPIQPIQDFNLFLNIADVHLIIQKADAGDLVMPSKLTTVLAVGGVAVITANEGSYMYSLVKRHNIGILVKAENQISLNEGIKLALTENFVIKENARLYAQQYLSIENIMSSFENIIC